MFEKVEPSLFSKDLLIKMFSYNIFEVRDILLLSLVCRRWRDLTQDDIIWRRLFIKDFSYEPNYGSGPSFFKECYKEQFAHIKKLKSDCETEHRCIEKPGLRQAVEEQNLSEIFALLSSFHYLYLEDFTNPDGNMQNLDKLLFEAEVDWSALQKFLVFSCALPRSLFLRFIRSHIWAKDSSGSIPLLILITCYADEESLRIIYKALGDELLVLGQLRNGRLKNFITILYDFPVERLELVLGVLRDTIGEDKLSQLLTYQSSSTRCGLSMVSGKVSEQMFPDFLSTYKQPMYLFSDCGLSYYDNLSHSAISVSISKGNLWILKTVFSEKLPIDQLSDKDLDRITQLTHRTPYKCFISSCIHEAIYNNVGTDYLSLLLLYIQKKDALIFRQEGRKYGIIPLFYFAHRGYERLVSQVLMLWGEDAPNLLGYRNCFGTTIVEHMFSNKSNSSVRKLIMETMCRDVRDFLSIWGTHILKHVTFSHSYQQNILRETLQLFKENDCFSIAQEFYMNDEFSTSFKNRKHRIISPDQDSEVFELLREFELEKPSYIGRMCIIA